MSKNTLKSIMEIDLFLDDTRHEEEIVIDTSLANPCAQIHLLPIECLDDFKNHPFNLYIGTRLSSMIKSIQEHGILNPIIVRPSENGRYEILAGHNRVNAAKKCNLGKVPAIIKDVKCDEEAFLIVSETNFMQRSFSEMTYSERALTVFQHHKALKSQGKRQDLLVEIEEYTYGIKGMTCFPHDEKINNTNHVGEQYNLSGRTISRYLRIYQLIDPLKTKLDNNKISFVCGEILSYLKENTQQMINDILDKEDIKLTQKKAQLIKEKEMIGNVTVSDVHTSLSINKNKKECADIILPNSLRTKYFKDDCSDNEILQIVEEALVLYFKAINNQEILVAKS